MRSPTRVERQCAVGVPLEHHAPDRDRLALPLELHGWARGQLRRRRERLPHLLSDEDLATFGRGAEAIRGVHRVTDDRELEASLRSDVPGERLPIVHGDAMLELR